MKAALLLFVGSHATAQIITAAPANIFNQVFNAAIGTDDPEFEICSALGNTLVDCLAEAGGPLGVDADEDKALSCACCKGSTPISKDYSTCASYFGGFATAADVEPLSSLYTVCSESATCGGFASGSASASASSATQRAATSATASTASSNPTVTAPPKQDSGLGNDDEACQDMSDMFLSCLNKTPGFDKMGYKSQAACYCCGGRNDASWTDTLDQAASSCWDWAESSQIGTTWDYAKTFATFCENFSDACDAGVSPKTQNSQDQETESTQTEDKEAKETNSSDDNDDDDDNKEDDDDDSAAIHVLPGSIVGVAVLVGALLAL